MSDPTTVLRHYLQQVRYDLIWKLDGLGEREARLPRTPTGNNLLGVLKLWVFADQTFDQLPLETPGRVSWWPTGRQDVTLQRMIVHVIYEVARHAGHVDIMREQHDGAIGWQREKTDVPDGYDWSGYVAKLTALADRSGRASNGKHSMPGRHAPLSRRSGRPGWAGTSGAKGRSGLV